MRQGETHIRVFVCFRKPDPKVLSVKRSELRLKVHIFHVARTLGRYSKDNDVLAVRSDKKSFSKAAG